LYDESLRHRPSPNDPAMSFFLDLRYALRQVRRSPGFALAAIASLALGLGANTTIFSVASALLFQPMRVPRADELVRVYTWHHSPFDFRDLRFMRERNTVFAHLIGENFQGATMATDREPERTNVSLVSNDFFPAMGIVPAAGRFFARRDDASPGAVPEVVLSHRFWQRRFGADVGVIGSVIRINDRAFTVAGVAAAGFKSSQYEWNVDLFVPAADSRALVGVPADSLGGSFYATARLKPGVSRDAANAQMQLLMRQLAATDSQRYARMTVRLESARGMNAELRGPVAVASSFLLVVSAIVLLIACANVGNLLLARNAARRREIGVRMALGAARSRLVRQLLIECGVVAVAAAAAALAVTAWTVGLFNRLIPADVPLSFDLSPDWRVLTFAAGACAATVVLFGLAPALQAVSSDVAAIVKDDGRSRGFRRSRLRGGFLVAQIALCTVLLTGASLFLRSLRNAQVIDPGFPTAQMLDLHLSLGSGRYDAQRGTELYSRLVDRIRSTPGVRDAALAALVPLSGDNMEVSFYRQGDAPLPNDSPRPHTYFNDVGPGYFQTMGIPLARGRDVAAGDRQGAPLVAIANETLASRLWPGQNPIGKRISFEGPTGPFMEIVGVAKNIKYTTLGETPPSFLYIPAAQMYRPDMTVHVRLAGGASVRQLQSALVVAVRDIDPALAPPTLKSLEEEQRVVLLPAKGGALLLGIFGTLALSLAAVGIFGVASYGVAQRRREIGIRSAIGARTRDVLQVVLAETARAVAIGGVIGIALSLGLGRLLTNQLYGVSGADPVTFLLVPLVLALVATVAALVPAFRAARVPPLVALRAG
jgi:putative ABC transport system permease protein